MPVLLTVGPTRESLDPVRFLTNASSGRMGYALAREAARRGARVTVVHGPTSEKPPRGARAVPVTSALQMRAAALRHARRAQAILLAAAVGDWRVQKSSLSKLKSGRPLTLRLVPNPDIAAELGALRRKGRLKARALVGFALETGDALKNARGKLERKGLDLIVANSPETLAGGCIRFTIVSRTARPRLYPRLTKRRAAAAILDAAEALL